MTLDTAYQNGRADLEAQIRGRREALARLVVGGATDWKRANHSTREVILERVDEYIECLLSPKDGE